MSNFSHYVRNFTIVALALILLAAAWAMFPKVSWADNSLEVTNGLIQQEVSGGEVITHTIVVGSNPTGDPLDLQVEARGYGRGLDGATQPLLPAEDIQVHSAREWITDIEPAAFSLAPGGTQEVTVTITVPDDPGEGTRYAIIYIDTGAVESGEGAAFVMAVSVPVVLTPSDVDLVKTGDIEDITVDEVISGQPLQIHTTLRNTGNHHFRAYNEITITDATGVEISFDRSSTPAAPIIPTYAHRFDAQIVPADKLATGTYHIISEVFRDDGTSLDRVERDFEVSIPWEVFPLQVIEESLQTFTFTDEEPSEIDAVEQSNIRITFADTGKVTGWVLTARYDEPPQVAVPFSSTGGEGILFSSIHTDGFTEGTATVYFIYSESEIRGYDETSLFLAYWNGIRWQRLDDIRVYSGANYVTGKVSVDRLIGAPIGLGGEEEYEGGPNISAQDDEGTNTTAPDEGDTNTTVVILWTVGLIICAIVIVGFILLLLRRRRRETANP